MFLYGLLVGPIGAGLIALAVAIFVYWADLEFAKQDRDYINNPRNALIPQPTQKVLDEAGVECSDPKKQG